MTQNEYITALYETLKTTDEAAHWLKRSYAICCDFAGEDRYTEEQYDAFEALTGRFARLSDMLLQRVFRLIDRLEFEDSGTLIDTVHRAEKRGLIRSADLMREIRELRNEIAHEYASSDLRAMFQDVVHVTPELFTIVENIHSYCKRFG